MINSMLASILSTINALLALGIILIGAGYGSTYATENGYSSGLGIVEACRVNDLEGEVAEPGIALPAIARHSWLIVDQRKAPPNETVE